MPGHNYYACYQLFTNRLPIAIRKVISLATWLPDITEEEICTIHSQYILLSAVYWLLIAIKEVIRLATWLPDITEEEICTIQTQHIFVIGCLLVINCYKGSYQVSYLVTRYNRGRNVYNLFSVYVCYQLFTNCYIENNYM